jgi:hypothetical protein
MGAPDIDIIKKTFQFSTKIYESSIGWAKIASPRGKLKAPAYTPTKNLTKLRN